MNHTSLFARRMILALGVILFAACTPAAPASPPAPPTPTPLPPTAITSEPASPAKPTKTQDSNALSTGKPVAIDVGGHSLIIYCYGTGEPVVVLESGLGATWSYWANVINGLKDKGRVCAYDRSDASNTSQQYVEDLHGLLAGAGLKGPYVLVGHSYGGMNVILYADKYPQEVAGVLLEDIFTPDFITRFLAALPASPDDTQDLKDDREFWGQTPLIIRRVDVTTSIDQVGAVKSLGDIPLIVLTAAAPDLDFGNVGEEAQAKIDEVDQATQKDLTNLSTNSKQVIASTNQHMIHEYVPEEVIAAILELVEIVRSK